MTTPWASERVRPPALAGSFYPDEPGALIRMVDDAITHTKNGSVFPKALIAPHAGYVYSGPVAGSAYATLLARRRQIKRVILLGPCHYVPVRGFAVPSARAFATPLGEVAIDLGAIAALRRRPDVEVRDDAHAPEHALEVQLPFLQRVLDDFALVPIIVGAAASEATAEVLSSLWGDEETLIVVSSDLSHYHQYDDARRLDLAASHAIETLKEEAIADEQACGRYPIKGLLSEATKRDLRATTLDLRNSGDTAGPRDRVVGYGAYAFESSDHARLSDGDRAILLDAARRSLRYGLRKGRSPGITGDAYPRRLRCLRAAFVTLKLGDDLRGCVGSLKPQRPLVADVVKNAFKAAFDDGRFAPLAGEELESVRISVSILSHPRPLECASEAEAAARLQPGEDGIILRGCGRSALFLPQVWKSISDPRQFLAQLKIKADLPSDYWSDDVRLWRFRTEFFSDAELE